MFSFTGFGDAGDMQPLPGMGGGMPSFGVAASPGAVGTCAASSLPLGQIPGMTPLSPSAYGAAPPGNFFGGGTRAGPYAGTSALLPSAPAGPGQPLLLATTERGGGLAAPTTILPAALRTLLASKRLPMGFDDLLQRLGADESDVTTDLFLLILEKDFVAALDEVTVDTVPLTPIGRARIISILRELFEECGAYPPEFGAAPRPGPAAVGVAPPLPPALAAPPEAAIVAMAPSTVNLAQVVDQSVKGQAPRLSFAELRDCRVHFEAVTGAAPSEHALPTAEQLAGLRALLLDGRVPFVDFAVWSPLGPRLAKFQRTEAAILVGGTFVTKTLEAPTSFAAWEDSWALFSVAMISLNAARPGSLGAYLDGIKALHRHFPGKWATIVAIDLVVRSERWLRIREDAERAPPAGYDPAAPWDFVIAASAYGRRGPMSMWWHMQVELPMSLGVAAPFAGLPGSSPAASSSSTSRPAPAQQGGGRRATPAPRPGGPDRSKAYDKSKEWCHSWNAASGPCAGDGPCPQGRRHVCRICGRDHRAVHVHGADRTKGSGRGSKDKKRNRGGRGGGGDTDAPPSSR